MHTHMHARISITRQKHKFPELYTLPTLFLRVYRTFSPVRSIRKCCPVHFAQPSHRMGLTHLLTVLMQTTGSKVCSLLPHLPWASMALSRRSSRFSGGNTATFPSDAPPPFDDSPRLPLGEDTPSLAAGGRSSSSLRTSASSLMALKELDSHMETRGLKRSLQPLHCRLFPTSDNDLYICSGIIVITLTLQTEEQRS